MGLAGLRRLVGSNRCRAWSGRLFGERPDRLAGNDSFAIS
jgi:hypothetical protein